jgi:hypothetical protein
MNGGMTPWISLVLAPDRCAVHAWSTSVNQAISSHGHSIGSTRSYGSAWDGGDHRRDWMGGTVTNLVIPSKVVDTASGVQDAVRPGVVGKR